jgi:hypothetical protein
MPYGMLEFAVKDPNGYLLSFGQHTGTTASSTGSNCHEHQGR